jgi:ornithine carbamoyltransferase
MKRLLNISDLNIIDIDKIFKFSNELQVPGTSSNITNKNIGLIFEKYSTRTRLSFHVGINQMGAKPIDIRFDELNIQRSESFEDTFKMFDLYLDAIIYRTNDHNKLIQASKYFNKPLINGLSDLSHPCQILADIFTLKKYFINNETITISWFGDMNNVLYSFFEISNLLTNIKINVFTSETIANKCLPYFPESKSVNIYNKIDKKIIGMSDCIMTDVYQSMNDKEDPSKENELIIFQVNKELMNMTKEDCVFCHCLPAKNESEVTKEVIDGKKSIILEQAYNRMVVQKGILKWIFN